MPTVPAKLSQLLARRGGRAGRSLGPGLDLAVAVGVRSLLARRREEAEHAAQWPERRVNLRIWSEAARACGVPLSELGGGFFELGSGAARARVWLHVTPLDDEVALRLALDKTSTNSLLAAEGLPVPEHVSFSLADPDPALRRVEAGGVWVVKPAGGTSSGQGTTVGVRSAEELLRASARASRSSESQLLERQVEGDEYRLLLLDGEPLGAVRRSAPSVAGDGVSSVAGLVRAENRRRLDALGEAGLKLITLDLDALLTLAREGAGPRTVPPAGTELRVKTARSQAGRRDSEAVELGAFAEELVEEARRAAATLGLRLAGVDLISSDPGRSLAASGGAIVEVNGTPGLHYHYLVSNPEAAPPVAVPILKRMLEAAPA
jgi:cyanophycin synthetase